MIKVMKSVAGNVIRELTLNTLEEGAWIHLLAPTRDELRSVAEATAIPFDLLAAPLDEEETSRVEVDDEAVLTLINLPKVSKEGDYDTIPAGIVVSERHIITICLEENDAIPQDVASAVSRHFCTFKRTRFLFQILYRTASLYLRYISQINRRSDDIEDRLRASMQNQELFQMLDLQKGLTFFTASIRSNRAVVQKLLRLCANRQVSKFIKTREEDEDLLEDVSVEFDQAFEMVQIYSNIMTNMMDAFASIISNNLNIVMKVLTLITIVMAIPSLVSGLWGMNVPVPFSADPYGFYIVVAFVLVLVVASFVAFWKKRLF